MLGLTLLLGGCQGCSGGYPEETTFRFAIGAMPRSLDPGLTTDNQSGQIVFNAFEGLTNYPAGSGAVVPGVAERWSLSDDGRIYTFFLRRDARWSNGDPVTAHDFEYAWKRVLNPETAAEYAWIMTEIALIEGAEAYNAGEGPADAVGVRALDDWTLEVRLAAPVPYFVDLTAFFTFMPVHRATVEAHETWTTPAHWVSNGPFVLSEQPDSKTFVLAKNPQYWDRESVAMERVVIKVVESDTSRLADFDAGNLDWTGPDNLPQSRVGHLRFRDDYYQDPYISLDYIMFNTRVPPLDDPRVREALALAIDRADLVTNTMKGIGLPAKGFVPPMKGYESAVQRATDVRRARELLAEAGYPGGRGFPTLTYLYPSASANAKAAGEVVQAQWKQLLGVSIELVNKEFKQVLEDQHTGNFQLSRAGWIGDYIDPSTFLGLYTSTSQQNDTGWKNERFDALMRKASLTPDREARYALYREAEQILDAEVPISPLWYAEQTYLLSPSIEGFEPHNLAVHLAKYVRKKGGR